MPKKPANKNAAETPAQPSEDATVRVVIRREHCLSPHSIELRRKDGVVTDARTEDWSFVYTIGAKTVADIFAEAGHEIPAGDGEAFEVLLSPYTGAVMAIQPKARDVSAETKNAAACAAEDDNI